MLKELPLFIGLRYIRSKRRNGFVSFVSGFSFGAMALGVAALIVVLSVMNGFAGEIHSRVLNVIPHLTVKAADPQTAALTNMVELAERLRGEPGVVAAAPYVEGFGMLNYAGNPQGVAIQGVDPGLERRVTGIDKHMLVGEFELLLPGEFGIVIGSQTARRLNAVVGDKLLLTLPELNRTLAGAFPRQRSLTVIGVFEVRAEVDAGVAFVHIHDAQKLYRRGNRADGLRLRLQQPLVADQVSAELQFTLGDRYQLKTWGQQLGSLFAAMQMEKLIVGLLLAIVVAVAAFNIVANLVLMVAEKRKDIAVLRSMGLQANGIMRIFVVQGSAVGLLGIAIGGLLGCVLGLWIEEIVAWVTRLLGVNVFDPQVYFISTLPSDLQIMDVWLVCSGALMMSVVATLYPAWRASRIQPAEALRYDH